MRFDVGQHEGWYIAMAALNTNLWEMGEVAAWCRGTFGTPGSRLDTASPRWRDQLYDGIIYFRDEADRTMFLVRWGS